MIPDLLTRILEADPHLHVADLVRRSVLSGLPDPIRSLFANRGIAWRPDREVWGLSFDLRCAEPVQLGHFQGHHIAMHPELHGLTLQRALWIVQREVEGVLLHGLGHAVVELWIAGAPPGQRPVSALRTVLAQEGWPSSYGAGDPHEGAAEILRWWVLAPARYAQHAPAQARLIAQILRESNDRLR